MKLSHVHVKLWRVCVVIGVAMVIGSGQPSPVVAQGGAVQAIAVAPITPTAFRGDVRTLPRVPQTLSVDTEFAETFNLKIFKPPADGGPRETFPSQAQAAMPSPIQNFIGLSHDDLCSGSPCGAGYPPDTNGDVGLNHFIQTVNTAVGIYSKTGTLLASFTFNSLWTGAGAGVGTPCNNQHRGDPITLYDPMADRWIISDLAFPLDGSNNPTPPYYQCFAVSMTNDPVAGGWWFYAVRTDDATHPWLHDYEKLGVWPDGIYMAANGFTFPAGTFSGTEAWAFNRSDMESGAPLRAFVAYIVNTLDPFTMIPSNVRGNTPGSQPPAGTPNYFVSESQTAFAFEVRKFQVNSTWTNATFSGPTNVSQSTYVVPGQNIIPQPGPVTTLDSLGDRLMQKVQYRKVGSAESLWVTHTFRSSNSGPTGSQWAQINVTGGTIATTPVQQQKYDPADGLYRWMSSIAADNTGNAALGYSASNATTNPSIRYSGRLTTDPLNSLPQTETILQAGGGAQTNNCNNAPCHRWGDYSEMSVDPVDDCTFWYTNEYYAVDGGNWNTRIGSFRFSSTQCVSSPVSMTPHSIIFDGGVGSDWNAATELLGTMGGFNYYATWDANNLYVGIKGGTPMTYTYTLVIDKDATNQLATNTGASAAFACTGGFNANGKGDFALSRTVGGSTVKNQASSGSWIAWTPSAATDTLEWGKNMAEFQVKFTDLGFSGMTNTIGLYMYVCNGANLISAWPPENLQSGTPTLNVETLIETRSAQTPRTSAAHWGIERVNANTTGDQEPVERLPDTEHHDGRRRELHLRCAGARQRYDTRPEHHSPYLSADADQLYRSDRGFNVEV